MANQSLLDKLVAESEADLIEAPDPTNAHPDAPKVGEVTHRGDATSPFAFGLSDHTGLYVNLWNTQTHEKITVLKWYARAALMKKHNDPAFPEWKGKPLFSTRPTGERVLGQYKCMLHREHPAREAYAMQGMPVCAAEHLASEHEAVRHMQQRHKKEWAQLQQAKAEADRQADRAATKAQADAMLELARSMARQKPTEAPAPPAPPEVRMVSKECPDCQAMIAGKGQFGYMAAERKHRKEKHASA